MAQNTQRSRRSLVDHLTRWLEMVRWMKFMKQVSAKSGRRSNQENVKKIEERRLDRDLRHDVKIVDSFVKFKDEYTNTFSNFEYMWDDHLGRTNKEIHRSELSPADAKSIHSAPYRERPETFFLEKWSSKRFLNWLTQIEQSQSYMHVCTWKELIPPISRRLLQTKSCDKARCLPDPTHGRVYPFTWLSHSLLKTGCKQWVLESWNRKRRMGKDGLYLTAQNVLFCADAIWITECSEYVIGNIGCCSFTCLVAVCTGVSWRYFRIISLYGGIHTPC